ncbi:hypothetical protein, partial [Psychrobacillus sp. FJAT-21963]
IFIQNDKICSMLFDYDFFDNIVISNKKR